MSPKALFMTTFQYAYVKHVGVEHWPGVLAHELANLDVSQVAGFRTMGEASRLAPLITHVDGSTYITRARCVAAKAFLRGAGRDADVWLTVDDDIYADRMVLERVLFACRRTRGLVALPYLNRDGHSMTFRRVVGPTTWVGGEPLRTVDRVGMGLVAMHRDFVEALDRNALHFEDGCPAIFLEGVQDVDPETKNGVWVGEDYWLCGLAERLGMPMHVLLDAPCEHMGMGAKLDVEGVICVAGEARARKLEEGIAAHAAARTVPPPAPRQD